MQRLRSMLVLLVVALGLGAYIYFVERHRAPASEEAPNEQLFTFEADDIAELHLRGTSGTTTELRRTDGTWEVVAPIEAAADETTLASVTSGLVSLEIRRVVEEDPVDLEPFGLAEPALDLGFMLAEDDAVDHLLIGEATPTGTDRYAKLSSADRVFLIAGYINTTFDKTTFDLRDKTMLVISRDDLDRLRITVDDQTTVLAKEGNDWKLTEPWDVRADFSTVEALVGRLTGTMQSIESEGENALDDYGLAEPAITATLSDGSAGATLYVGGEAPGARRYARDSSRDLVFTVQDSLATDLGRSPSDYRRKDLFGFRPFNATRLEIERAEDTVVFEKSEATTEGEDQWKRVQPEAQNIDSDEMDDLLAKLSSLRVQSWIESRGAAGLGDTDRLVTVRARFGEEATEDLVTVWRTGEETFAVHGDEPGAATIDAGAFDDALAAFDAVQTEDS